MMSDALTNINAHLFFFNSSIALWLCWYAILLWMASPWHSIKYHVHNINCDRRSYTATSSCSFGLRLTNYWHLTFVVKRFHSIRYSLVWLRISWCNTHHLATWVFIAYSVKNGTHFLYQRYSTYDPYAKQSLESLVSVVSHE